MKCVVTGGNGFIGRHVVSELIRRGFDVVVYDASAPTLPEIRVKFVRDDIRNAARLRETLIDADFIFHFAGVVGTHELFDDPKEAVDININGAINVLLGCLAANKAVRVLFPTKPLEWNNVYSITAQARERLGHAYRENMNLDVRLCLLRNVYGPGQKLTPVRKAVPLFILQALENRALEIFGDGSQLVELLYVEDVAKVMVDYLLYDGDVSETFELRADDRMNVETLAREIISKTGSKSKIAYLPMRMGEPHQMPLAPARDLRELLGEMTLISFEEGMHRTIDWYRRLPQSVLTEARELYFGSDYRRARRA